MALPESETAARLELGVLILVYNDAAHGAEVHHFGPMGEAVDLVQFPETDFPAIGRAMGLDGLTIRRVEDLEPLKAWVTGALRTGLVLDAKVMA